MKFIDVHFLEIAFNPIMILQKIWRYISHSSKIILIRTKPISWLRTWDKWLSKTKLIWKNYS